MPEWTHDAPGIKCCRYDSATDFVESLRRSADHWWESGQMPWVFRGHADDRWKLVPSSWRPDNELILRCRTEAERRFEAIKPTPVLRWIWQPGNFFSAAATFGQNDANLARQLAVETTAELLPIWDFALACDALGLPSPLVGLPADRDLDPDYMFFPANPLVSDDLGSYSDLPAMLALAQHHGLPTRLLDWSFNPQAAAFFAAERLKTPIEGRAIVVWALHRQRARQLRTKGVQFPNGLQGSPPIQPQLQILRPPARDNAYLSAQSGAFTTISGSGIYFMQNGGSRPSLEDFVAASGATDVVLRKLVLPHEHAADLSEILKRENVSRSIFMPTRDNVAADVRQRWLLMPDA